MEFINLQRLSAICIASKIWERPDIKLLIRKLFLGEIDVLSLAQDFQKVNHQSANLLYFLSNKVINPSHEYEKNEKRHKQYQFIIHKALQYLDSIHLPLIVKIYCQDVLGEMGEKIYNWLANRSHERMTTECKLAEQIYWTPYGTIDEGKTLLQVKECQKCFDLKTGRALYELACMYAQVDFIKNNQQEMGKYYQTLNSDFNLDNYDDKEYTLMSLFMFPDVDRDFSGSKCIVPPSYLLELCAYAGLPAAVVYLWDITRELIDEKCLEQIVRRCLENLLSYYECNNHYRRERSVEAIIFLINQMSEQLRNKLLQVKDIAVKLFCQILHVWPFNDSIHQLMDNYFTGLSGDNFREVFKCTIHLIRDNKMIAFTRIKYLCSVFDKFFINIGLYLYWPYASKTKNILFWLSSLLPIMPLNEIIFRIIDNFFSELSGEKYEFKDIFYKTVSLIRDNEEVFFKKKYFYLVFEKLLCNQPEEVIKSVFGKEYFCKHFQTFDVECLNFILSKMNKNSRLEIIKGLQIHKLYISQEVKLEQLKQLYDQVLATDEERKFYKDYLLSVRDESLMDIKLETAEKILDCLFLPEEERALFQNRIDCLKACEESIISEWRCSYGVVLKILK